MRASTLQSDARSAGGIAIYGANGVLEEDALFTYDTLSDILSVPNLDAFTAVGAIHFNSQAMSDVNIDSGTIDGISQLTASSDIDIGAHNLRANTLQADSGAPGRIVAFGANGELVSSEALSFTDDSRSRVVATSLEVGELLATPGSDLDVGSVRFAAA